MSKVSSNTSDPNQSTDVMNMYQRDRFELLMGLKQKQKGSVLHLLKNNQIELPNSKRLMNSPITVSCINSDERKTDCLS